MLKMLSETDIFIHEFYANFGMFNTDKSKKSIYDFGLNPKVDICIPSFNDKFILVGDIVAFDTEIRKKAIQDYNVIGKLSEQTLSEIYAIRDKNIAKFLEVCRLSDLPEFEEVYNTISEVRRMWHNSNHVSIQFTGLIFEMLVGELGLKIDTHFIKQMYETDMYANIQTPLTEYDNFMWGEPIKPLRELL